MYRKRTEDVVATTRADPALIIINKKINRISISKSSFAEIEYSIKEDQEDDEDFENIMTKSTKIYVKFEIMTYVRSKKNKKRKIILNNEDVYHQIDLMLSRDRRENKHIVPVTYHLDMSNYPRKNVEMLMSFEIVKCKNPKVEISRIKYNLKLNWWNKISQTPISTVYFSSDDEDSDDYDYDYDYSYDYSYDDSE